jgi:hypothetical protein
MSDFMIKLIIHRVSWNQFLVDEKVDENNDKLIKIK